MHGGRSQKVGHLILQRAHDPSLECVAFDTVCRHRKSEQCDVWLLTDGEHSSVSYTLKTTKHGFEIPWFDAHPPDFDLPVHTAQMRKRAFGAADEQIACRPNPTSRVVRIGWEGGPVKRPIDPGAKRHVGAADYEFARLPIRHWPTMLIDQAQVVARQWRSKRDTTRCDSVRHVQQTTKDPPTLAGAVGQRDLAVGRQDLSEHDDVAAEHRVSAEAECPKRAEGPTGIGSTRQQAGQGWDHRTDSDAGVAQHRAKFPEPVGSEIHEVQRGSSKQGAERITDANERAGRMQGQHAVGLSKSDGARMTLYHTTDHAFMMCDAAWPSCAARGIDNERRAKLIRSIRCRRSHRFCLRMQRHGNERDICREPRRVRSRSLGHENGAETRLGSDGSIACVRVARIEHRKGPPCGKTSEHRDRAIDICFCGDRYEPGWRHRSGKAGGRVQGHLVQLSLSEPLRTVVNCNFVGIGRCYRRKGGKDVVVLRNHQGMNIRYAVAQS